jgi:biotin operon repressor
MPRPLLHLVDPSHPVRSIIDFTNREPYYSLSGPPTELTDMPRFRGTKEPAATLVGRLLLLIATEQHTSVTLAQKLGISPRQVNRYILELVKAGWQIERRGVPTHQDYYFELVEPKVNPRSKKT